MKNLNNIEVDYYTELSKNDGSRFLSDVLIAIKKGSTQKDVILEIRDKCKKEENYSGLKKTLEAFTPSGTFNDARKINNLNKYSGVLVLDIDNLGIRKLPILKKKVIDCPYTLAAFISPSGTGLKILVKVDTNSNMHNVAFKQVSEYYTSEMDIDIDTSGKDVSRLCFISYDSDLYENKNALVFKVIDSFQADYQKALKTTQIKEEFKEGSRNNFIHYLACNCNRIGIPETVAESLITDNYKYSGEDFSKTIKSAFSNSNEFNIKGDIEAPIEKYLMSKYVFRYNVFNSRVEFKRISAGNFISMTDYHLNSFVRELKSKKFKIGKQTLDNLFLSDFTPEFHPLKEYLNSLPIWDEKTDYISELASRIATDDDDFFKEAFKRWFVAMIGCGVSDRISNQTMIIMSGGQGIGKSTFIKNMLPKELRDYAFSGMINPTSKDALIHLSERLIIDLDELSSLTKRGNNEIKELITKSSVKIRRPYGRITDNLPRRASFIGSINDDEFLTDLTGNRRYLSFLVKSIDYTSLFNYSGIFSQALFLFNNSFKYYFDGKEIEKINERNEKFRRKSPIEEILLDRYKPASDMYNAELYLSSSELLIELNNNAKIQMSDTNHIQIGKVLTMLNFKKVKKGGRNKYAIDRANNSSSQGKIPLRKVS
jgi:hypothetical protein